MAMTIRIGQCPDLFRQYLNCEFKLGTHLFTANESIVVEMKKVKASHE